MRSCGLRGNARVVLVEGSRRCYLMALRIKNLHFRNGGREVTRKLFGHVCGRLLFSVFDSGEISGVNANRSANLNNGLALAFAY